MGGAQRRMEALQQKNEELQRKMKDPELLEGFGDCQVEPLEPRTEETELPSATQFSSYLENFFEGNGASDHKFRRVAQKKLASIENILTAFSKIPAEETSLFLFLELPRTLLELIRGEVTDFADLSRDFQGWKTRMAEEAQVCCEMARMTLREINGKVLEMTRRMAHLQVSFTQLVGQRLGFSQEKLQTLERALPEIPDILRANILEVERAGRLSRQPLHRAGAQRKRNVDAQAAVFGEAGRVGSS